MVVGLSPAEGDFVLPKRRPRNILLISGGSGITPVMSMLRTLCNEGHKGSVTFIHYTRSYYDALYAAELDELQRENPKLTIVHATTRRRAKTAPIHGHLTHDQLKKVCPDFASAQTYVCGPNSLIDTASAIWQRHGLEAKLHTEQFVLPEPVVEEDATGTLSFSRSGRETENSGQSLLAQAEAAGLKPRSGCRMGICHTCIAEVRCGSVRNVRTGEVKNVNNELVQICMNAPAGDIEIDL
jgi:ferredoxin-NADP reductase